VEQFGASSLSISNKRIKRGAGDGKNWGFKMGERQKKRGKGSEGKKKR